MLENSWGVQFFKEIIFQKRLKIIFLCEIISKKEKVDQVKFDLGFEASFVVEARGHNGVIAMLWKK